MSFFDLFDGHRTHRGSLREEGRPPDPVGVSCSPGSLGRIFGGTTMQRSLEGSQVRCAIGALVVRLRQWGEVNFKFPLVLREKWSCIGDNHLDGSLRVPTSLILRGSREQSINGK